MGIACGWRERTYKDKAFIFSQIGHLHQQRTHSEYHLRYQLFAAISRPISANFEWIASSRLQNCELSRSGGRMAGGESCGREVLLKVLYLKK
jgi:hypothetical protein